MNRAIGLALLVVGLILLGLGIQASDSFSSHVSKLFTGSPSDKAVWYLAAGAASAVIGGVLLGRKI